MQEKTREMCVCASCARSSFLRIEANLKIYRQLLEIAAKKKWQSIAFEKEVQYRFANVVMQRWQIHLMNFGSSWICIKLSKSFTQTFICKDSGKGIED